MHIRLRDFYKVRMYDRIDIDVVRFVILSNYLVMNLRAGGNINDNVCPKCCLATQSTVVREPTPLRESFFGFAPG
jgi:hypothetical protein